MANGNNWNSKTCMYDAVEHDLNTKENDKFTFDENKTPEQNWEYIKEKVFNKGAPKHIDELLKDGFKNAVLESEKWELLGVFMVTIKQRFS